MTQFKKEFVFIVTWIINTIKKLYHKIYNKKWLHFFLIIIIIEMIGTILFIFYIGNNVKNFEEMMFEMDDGLRIIIEIFEGE